MCDAGGERGGRKGGGGSDRGGLGLVSVPPCHSPQKSLTAVTTLTDLGNICLYKPTYYVLTGADPGLI